MQAKAIEWKERVSLLKSNRVPGLHPSNPFHSLPAGGCHGDLKSCVPDSLLRRELFNPQHTVACGRNHLQLCSGPRFGGCPSSEAYPILSHAEFFQGGHGGDRKENNPTRTFLKSCAGQAGWLNKRDEESVSIPCS